MLRSMTAFGRARGVFDELCITVEIKSVNNRYFDCAVKLPRGYTFLEDGIRQHLAARGIMRGKLDVLLGVENLGGSGASVRPDLDLARSYMAALDTLRDTFSLADDRTLMSLAQNKELFLPEKAQTDEEKTKRAVLTVLEEATNAFLDAREREGARLCADLAAKKAHFAEYLPRIEALGQARVEQYRQRLESRMRALLAEYGVSADEGRLLTEVGLFADRAATDEETVRLRSHLEAFDQMLQSNEAVGRKLDFLLQEMNRETNTIGSKANDLAITKLVIEMKNELEKIREQIQNIE